MTSPTVPWGYGTQIPYNYITKFELVNVHEREIILCEAMKLCVPRHLEQEEEVYFDEFVHCLSLFPPERITPQFKVHFERILPVIVLWIGQCSSPFHSILEELEDLSIKKLCKRTNYVRAAWMMGQSVFQDSSDKYYEKMKEFCRNANIDELIFSNHMMIVCSFFISRLKKLYENYIFFKMFVFINQTKK